MTDTLFLILCILICLGVTGEYVRRVLKGEIKPHLYTWLIWTIATAITAAARWTEGAGLGAANNILAALSCLCVVMVSIKYGEKHITRMDRGALVAVLAALPLWYITNDAFTAIVLVTTIDLLGYIPTIRKSWHKPYEEAMFNYVVANICHILTLLMTRDFSLATLLTPVCLFAANTALILVILLRRRRFGIPQPPAA